jgi:hypothetical protein
MADFRIIDHGSVVTVMAVSDAAKDFAEENFAVPGWMGSPHRFTTDHRPAHMLVEQIMDQGFDVDGI